MIGDLRKIKRASNNHSPWLSGYKNLIARKYQRPDGGWQWITSWQQQSIASNALSIAHVQCQTETGPQWDWPRLRPSVGATGRPRLQKSESVWELKWLMVLLLGQWFLQCPSCPWEGQHVCVEPHSAFNSRAAHVIIKCINGSICKPGFSCYYFITASNYREKHGLPHISEYNLSQRPCFRWWENYASCVWYNSHSYISVLVFPFKPSTLLPTCLHLFWW